MSEKLSKSTIDYIMAMQKEEDNNSKPITPNSNVAELCPKCGSEYILVKDGEVKCADCNAKKYKTNTELEIQQRIDNVLSKFESYLTYEDNDGVYEFGTVLVKAFYYKNKDIHRFDNEYEAVIKYDTSTENFYINNWMEDLLEISLDTVESLIKDMEATDEK